MIFCWLFLGASAFAGSSASRDSACIAEIRGLEAAYGGRLGLMAKNLKTGETVAYNASERFPTASVIKLPIMAAFFHMVDRGQIDPSVKVVLARDDKKPSLLEQMSDGMTMTLMDAVKLMIVLSDNTAANLVLDRLAGTHEERLRVVNDLLVEKGLKNTRLLNRLYTWSTKKETPEAIRYGIGVSTPEDMVVLLEALYRKTLVDPSSCDAMLAILKEQFYNDMIPRLLPAADCKVLEVAHKTGGVSETKVDVGLVLSDRADIAMAIFVDKHPDHREDVNNGATMLAALVARAVWNGFTGMTGFMERRVDASQVGWNMIPGGKWGIYRSGAAPFPHRDRAGGYKRDDGTVYPWFPHYADSSVVVFVPDGFHETPSGANIIVHFHGHLNDNLGVLERYRMPQAMTAQKINALLVLPQGPNRARDSFGGKMEDEGGFRRLVDDVLATMLREGVLKSATVGQILISAHSRGYRPAAFALERGGLTDHVHDLFLFDAFYAQQEYFRGWLEQGSGTLTAAYTDHLEQEHVSFSNLMKPRVGDRLRFMKTTVDHDSVVQTYFGDWLSRLDSNWKMTN
jgi:beta-lactamase class A